MKPCHQCHFPRTGNRSVFGHLEPGSRPHKLLIQPNLPPFFSTLFWQWMCLLVAGLRTTALGHWIRSITRGHPSLLRSHSSWAAARFSMEINALLLSAYSGAAPLQNPADPTRDSRARDVRPGRDWSVWLESYLGVICSRLGIRSSGVMSSARGPNNSL